MSSSSSWNGDGEYQRSPIPYRIGPLEYEPAVMCHCRKKAALWISWSNANPGRRYLKCYRARSGGCNFICWYEGPVDDFIRDLLVDLRDAVRTLQRENRDLKAALADATVKINQQKKDISSLLEAREEDNVNMLEAREEGNVESKKKKKILWMFGVCLFVAVVVAYLR